MLHSFTPDFQVLLSEPFTSQAANLQFGCREAAAAEVVGTALLCFVGCGPLLSCADGFGCFQRKVRGACSSPLNCCSLASELWDGRARRCNAEWCRHTRQEDCHRYVFRFGRHGRLAIYHELQTAGPNKLCELSCWWVQSYSTLKRRTNHHVGGLDCFCNTHVWKRCCSHNAS